MPSLFTLVYYLLTIGITATTAERFFGMFASAIMIAIKCFFIVTSSSTNSSSVVLQYIQIQQLVMYLLPILAMLFICFRAAEKERRLK